LGLGHVSPDLVVSRDILQSVHIHRNQKLILNRQYLSVDNNLNDIDSLNCDHLLINNRQDTDNTTKGQYNITGHLHVIRVDTELADGQRSICSSRTKGIIVILPFLRCCIAVEISHILSIVQVGSVEIHVICGRKSTID